MLEEERHRFPRALGVVEEYLGQEGEGPIHTAPVHTPAGAPPLSRTAGQGVFGPRGPAPLLTQTQSGAELWVLAKTLEQLPSEELRALTEDVRHFGRARRPAPCHKRCALPRPLPTPRPFATGLPDLDLPTSLPRNAAGTVDPTPPCAGRATGVGAGGWSG